MYWKSGQGVYLPNRVVASMASNLNIQHRLAVSYYLWKKGTAESLNHDILAFTPTIAEKLELVPQHWMLVNGMISSILKMTPE